MADLIISVTKNDMKQMEKNANTILELKGVNPEEYWYQLHLQLVSENFGLLVQEPNNKE
ncbi:hypothetical protein [Ruoffia tabacinasalis]|uniref:hypothetical protein n=1 Tax=Ruoffia tabacinasalis TaxID=87458 RepID=UPI001487523D|nr:hypothetical protein [Ruoffia tabacinasalis]